jgi:hypothetical protein
MRFRNEIAPMIGGSNGANQKSKCLGGQRNIATLGTTGHEARIASLGQDLIKAYASGDRSAAQQYQRAMYQAIAQRAPASQAERFAEIDQAIAGNAGCYFVERGDADRAGMEPSA